MNKIIVFGACISFLIACSPKTTEAPMKFEPSKKSLSESAMKGEKLYIEHCGKCHKLEPIHEFSEARWKRIVPDMAKKSKLNDEQESFILTYVLEELK